MTDDNNRPQTGWYIDLAGRRAYCIVDDRLVRVTYEDSSFTCADHATFRRWGMEPEIST